MKNKTLSRVIKLVKPKTKPLIIITILAIMVSLIEIAKPYLIKIVIDDYLSYGITTKENISIEMLGIIYIIITLLGSLLYFAITTSTSIIGEDVIYSLRNKLYKYIMNANIPFHDKTPSGTLFVRTISDVEDISSLFKDVITTFFKDAIMIIALIVMMLLVDYRLSLICLLLIPFVAALSIAITKISRKVREYSKKVKTDLNVFLAESIYGAKIIKLFNRQNQKEKQCQTLCQKFYKSRIPTAFTNGFIVSFMIIFENLGISIIIWACVYNFWNINLDVGTIYLFITYLKQIFEPIQRIVENFETIQEAIVSINKIYDILDKEKNLENLESGIIPNDLKGKIEFKNVWFSYKKDEWILKNVSFTINPGESVALVGKTGAGKTTIINLINRFYDIQKGQILLDGIDIKELNIKYLRKKVGMVLQKPFIFANSIKDNIRLNDNIPDDIIKESIALASANNFIDRLPNGINEIAYERGSSFSAGEKQLLAFARIFAHNPSVFILDEATANIDTKTEALIKKSIDKISKNKTSIFIAHRLSTIVNVDKIIVLENGKIVEKGNHNDLMSIENGYYKKLYSAYYEGLVR